MLSLPASIVVNSRPARWPLMVGGMHRLADRQTHRFDSQLKKHQNEEVSKSEFEKILGVKSGSDKQKPGRENRSRERRRRRRRGRRRGRREDENVNK